MPKWESKCQPFELLKVREIFHNSFFCVFNDKFSVEIKNDPNETDLVCFETRITQTHEILLITSSLPVFVTTSSVNFYFTLKIYQTPFSQFDFSLARFFLCPCVCWYDGSILFFCLVLFYSPQRFDFVLIFVYLSTDALHSLCHLEPLSIFVYAYVSGKKNFYVFSFRKLDLLFQRN